jgi:DNA-binding beta-propeller fold protein YncE
LTEGQIWSLAVHEGRGLWAEAGDSRLVVRSTAAQAALVSAVFSGQPQGLVFAPDGNSIYLATRLPDRVLRFSVNSGQQLAVGPLLAGPGGLAWANGRLWAANTLADEVLALDPHTLAVMERVALPGRPYAIAANPAGGHVFVGLAGSSQVAVLDPAAGRVIRHTELAGLGFPQHITVDLGSGRVYIASLLAPRYGLVTVLDASGRIIAAIEPTLRQPLRGAAALAVAPAASALIVSDQQGLQVFDLASLEYRRTLPVSGAAWPFGLAVDAVGAKIYIAGPAGAWLGQQIDSSD